MSNHSEHLKPISSWPKNERYAQRHRDRGLCQQCPRKVEPGRKFCKSCLEKNRLRMLRKYDMRREQGLCLSCGRPVEKGFRVHNRNECIPSRRMIR